MKVIFLDVDGVLNSEDDLRVFREKNNITETILYAEVEDRPLKLLKELVEKSGAKIVVSSSWRRMAASSQPGPAKKAAKYVSVIIDSLAGLSKRTAGDPYFLKEAPPSQSGGAHSPMIPSATRRPSTAALVMPPA